MKLENTFFLQMRKLKLQRLNGLPGVITDSKWQGCILDLDAVIANSMCFCGNIHSPSMHLGFNHLNFMNMFFTYSFSFIPYVYDGFLCVYVFFIT